MATVEFFGFNGESVPEAQFREMFGDILIDQHEDAPYAVTQLRAVTGFMSLRVRVLDVDGNPEENVGVLFSWPDGAVTALTKADGYAELIMGDQSFYFPPDRGPYNMSLDAYPPKETVAGGGWVGNTPHDHFDTIIQRQPEGPGNGDDDVIAHLQTAQQYNFSAAQHIQAALDDLQDQS